MKEKTLAELWNYNLLCPICHDSYTDHNYHDDCRCLEIIRDISKILREQRDSY